MWPTGCGVERGEPTAGVGGAREWGTLRVDVMGARSERRAGSVGQTEEPRPESERGTPIRAPGNQWETGLHKEGSGQQS